MPLPENNTPWPPPQLAAVTPKLEEWAAWWVGDPEGLRAAYQRPTGKPADRPSQYRGGIVGAAARLFWGRPQNDLTSARTQLHVPIAADLCTASADLLFSEPPTFTVEGTSKATQDRLDALTGDGLHATIAEAAETAAAMGGAYLRVTWDQAVDPDGPFLTVVHSDRAAPEFAWGRLRAVTFWTLVRVDGQRHVRHLERHELRDGTGVVVHGLFEGTADNLGRAVPLTEHPATAALADLVDADSAISTESPGLGVVYVPNQRPQRRWRNDPVGASLGRSDLDGVEHLMDALDETYSSWMRDVRLGKARILAAASILEDGGPGRGLSFDADQEVFTPVNMLQRQGSERLPIETVQFDIRYAEHAATAQQLLEAILRTAGYSAQTFGEGDGQVTATATEVNSRDQRSLLTRSRKARLWRPQLQDAAVKLLAVDRAIFGTPNEEAPVEVTWSPAVREAPLVLAQTAQALRTARAASTETLVRLQNPTWDDEAVRREVAAIDAEDAVPEPAAPSLFG
ncbi:hypothetical protein GCM10027586_03860 [Kineococcus gypseus]|uniref:phage portal protein n=1 Tax=Kineococcus gypseus TaxID=1637102 RepID=UPI003D7DA8C7